MNKFGWWVRAQIRKWVGIDALADSLGRENYLLRKEVQLARESAAKAEAAAEQVLILLRPMAPRLREVRPALQSWDQVQQENLKEFEVVKNGKSIR